MNKNHSPLSAIPFKDLAQETLQVLIRFLQEPWTQINHLPQWPWPRLLLTQLAVSSATAGLGGLSQSFVSTLAGLIISPIISLVTLSISALVLLYFTKIVSQQKIPFQALFELAFFANIPLFILQIVSHHIPIISLVGLAFSAFLIYVGLTETHKVNRLIAKKVLAGLYLIFLLIWIWTKIDIDSIERKIRDPQIDAPEVHLGQ